MDKNSSIVILGAGPCGLAAAWALTEGGFSNVTVLEKNNNVGGITRSEIINGNSYEYGAHYFHSDNIEIINKVLSLLGGNYAVNKRNLMIKFNGRYFKYPLKINDLICGFKLTELSLFFISMIYSLIKSRIFPKKLLSAEDILIAKYGSRLYKKFFEGYIVNFWAMHPSKLSANFAQRRISRLDALELLKKLLSIFKIGRNNNKQDEVIEVVTGNLYYPYQGMGVIWDKMASEIIKNRGKILTNVTIENIANDESNIIKSISFRNEEAKNTIYPEILISTIPIHSFLNYLVLGNEEIQRISLKLKYRSLVIIGLLVANEKILPSYCTYYHDHIFNRVSEPKLAGLKVNPGHYTVLLTETSCNFDDEIWNNPERLINDTCKELEEEGLLTKDNVKEIHILKERFAYPVFDLDYEENIERIKGYLSGFHNLYSAGRQGSFEYINAHRAIKMGFEIANIIKKKNTKQ